MRIGDNEFYSNLYYDLFISYDIKINSEYQFIYDEFLEHLVSDTNKMMIKKYKNFFLSPALHDTTKHVFKGIFYNHFSSSIWYNKIKSPDTSPELKRRLRNNKLKNILNGCK